MELKTRTLVHDGIEETLYFKPLNTGEQLQLAKGQKVTQDIETGRPQVTLDLGDQLEKGMMLLRFTLVDANGRTIFKDNRELYKIESKKTAKMIALAKEVNGEGEGEDESPVGK